MPAYICLTEVSPPPRRPEGSRPRGTDGWAAAGVALSCFEVRSDFRRTAGGAPDEATKRKSTRSLSRRGDRMRRRDFIPQFTSAALAWPLGAHAQVPASNRPMIGWHRMVDESDGGRSWLSTCVVGAATSARHQKGGRNGFLAGSPDCHSSFDRDHGRCVRALSRVFVTGSNPPGAGSPRCRMVSLCPVKVETGEIISRQGRLGYIGRMTNTASPTRRTIAAARAMCG